MDYTALTDAQLKELLATNNAQIDYLRSACNTIAQELKAREQANKDKAWRVIQEAIKAYLEIAPIEATKTCHSGYLGNLDIHSFEQIGKIIVDPYH